LLGVLVGGFVIPRTLTSSGAFVVQPATSRIVMVTDTAVVAEVLVLEGMRVFAGTPVVRLVDREPLRAPIAGTVLTRRPEDLVGRRVRPGDSLMVVAALDSVEVRIALANVGATRVRPGQVAHLVSYASAAAPRTGHVSDVSAASVGAGDSPSGVEARVRMAYGAAWRPGMRGEARIEIERSTLFGVVWSTLRQWVRTDLWL
jgi:multidrug efflux pump subunit AcrA (membrane-fusion protein)